MRRSDTLSSGGGCWILKSGGEGEEVGKREAKWAKGEMRKEEGGFTGGSGFWVRERDLDTIF